MDRDEVKIEEGGGSGSSDPETSKANSSNKGSIKRISKDSKPKQVSTARFQCPRCPKNFTRIENLTRHQANHDDVGKFACTVCQKRFTRSDLLNRHRRIHGESSLKKAHVTQSGDISELNTSKSERIAGKLQTDHYPDVTHEKGYVPPPAHSQTEVQQASYYPHHQQQYQQILPQKVASTYDSPITQNQYNQVRGLSNLVEAALAPRGFFSFAPAENLNPSSWDGFMLFDNAADSYMGTFDTDMSWTLNQDSPTQPQGFTMDYSMEYNAMETEFLDPWRQAHPYQPPTEVNKIEASDAVDVDTNDWPDKVSPPGSPPRHAPRIVPVQLLPMSWREVIDEARASGLNANTIQPNQHITEQLRLTLLNLLNGTSHPRNELSRPEISDPMFPPCEALDYFVRLYVKNVHPRFPVLHFATFDIYTAPPLLLVAMIFLGSSHSKVDQGRLSRIYYVNLRIAIMRMHESDETYLRIPENTFTFCLLCMAGTWSGSKKSYAFAEAARGIMVTACRRGRLLDCRPSSKMPVQMFERPGMSKIHATWLAWVATEKRKRLGLAILIYDSQYPALFNNQPYVSKAETTNCVFPCPEEYWDAPSAEQWKMLVGPADMPPSTYYLHALNTCLLRKKAHPAPPIPKTNELDRIVLIYTILTQIFEWRQSTSMLNPTGLMGQFGNSASQDLSSELKARRKFLLDALDSWDECYNRLPTASSAGILLHHLGYISLDVSLSDMHLAAGRSMNKADMSFAEDSLRSWANSSISDGTMTHVFSMLGVCHQVIANGGEGRASFEVAVCLFTGGIVCWAYARLRSGVDREVYREQVRRASVALRSMGCWRTCGLYGRILSGFENLEAVGGGNMDAMGMWMGGNPGMGRGGGDMRGRYQGMGMARGRGGGGGMRP